MSTTAAHTNIKWKKCLEVYSWKLWSRQQDDRKANMPQGLNISKQGVQETKNFLLTDKQTNKQKLVIKTQKRAEWSEGWEDRKHRTICTCLMALWFRCQRDDGSFQPSTSSCFTSAADERKRRVRLFLHTREEINLWEPKGLNTRRTERIIKCESKSTFRLDSESWCFIFCSWFSFFDGVFKTIGTFCFSTEPQNTVYLYPPEKPEMQIFIVVMGWIIFTSSDGLSK